MKRLTTVLGILTLLIISLSHAQQRWTRTYGGAGYDVGLDVQQTQDGGYIIGGYTSSFGAGSYDVWLLRLNAQGDTLWAKTYGGISDDRGVSVQQTQDGGYIIAGHTDSFGAGYIDFYLLRTNASGDTLWTKTYGSTGFDWANSVQQTQDGGYIIAGWTDSFGAGRNDVYLIKTDANGDTLWSKTYGGPYDDEGLSVQQTQDSGYIITGYSDVQTIGNPDLYLIKTDAQGDTLWIKTYRGDPDFGDVGCSVRQSQDGGYIIAGLTGVAFSNMDVWLLKTDAQGDTLWAKTYGGDYRDQGYSVHQTSDGGYIIAGYTQLSSSGPYDVNLIKTDASGVTLWTRTYGGSNYEEGHSVWQTTDTGYIITGFTTSYGGGLQDVYVIKTDPNGIVGVETPVRQLGGSTLRQLKATPNPFTSFATLPGHEGERFSLYDISGRKVGTFPGDRIGEGLAPGVYFLRSSDNKDKPLRIVKVR
jgi:hypothetical protein